MRELLYLSEMKLHDTFLDSEDSLKKNSRKIDLSIGPSIANLKYSRQTDTVDDSDATKLARKLEQVIKYLEKSNRVVDFTTPDLLPNQWISFDLAMKYGKVRKDGAPEWVPGDVVLFGGSSKIFRRSEHRVTDLLLCGSAHHLRGRKITYSDRMGSDTTWLYELIKSLEKREQRGIHVIPRFISELASPTLSLCSPEEVARGAFHGLIESEFPRPDHGRLSGHARVLADIGKSSSFTRFLLATPLYVELMPPPRKQWYQFRRSLLMDRRNRKPAVDG